MFLKSEILVLFLNFFGLVSLKEQCLGLNCLKPKSNVSPSHNMFGGGVRDSLTYPFIAAVQEKSTKKIICSGIIISSTVVATACHCVAFVQQIRHRKYTLPVVANKKELTVAAGFGKYEIGVGTVFEQRRSVSNIMLHPKCKKIDTWEYDLALVTLKGSFIFNTLVNQSFIDIIPNRQIWDSKITENLASKRICKVVGFGWPGISTRFDNLLEQKVVLTENGCREDKCKHLYTSYCSSVLSNGICAFSINEEEYPGDGAAAVICGDEILGLATDGLYTPVDYFTVFTRIDHLDFLQSENTDMP